MRCLTLHQPYPFFVIRGAKGWETRSRRTNYRGPVAIHAGVSVSHLPVGRTVTSKEARLLQARGHSAGMSSTFPAPGTTP